MLTARRALHNTASGGGGTPTLVVATAAQSTNQTTSTTAAIDTTGASLLVVAVAFYPGGSSGGLGSGTLEVTDSKSNAWSPLTRYGPSTVNGGVQLFYCSNSPSVGTSHTFTAQATGNAGNVFPGIAVAAFSGTLNAATPDFDVGATVASGTSIQPGSGTPAHANEVVITGFCNASNGSAASIDSSFTIDAQVVHDANSDGAAIAHLIQTTATAENPTWSGLASGSTLAAAMTSFQ